MAAMISPLKHHLSCVRQQEYKQQMETELRNDSDPLDANLEKVIPGMFQWQQANLNSVEGLKREVAELNETVKAYVGAMIEESRSERAASEQRLATAFRQLAAAYDGGEQNLNLDVFNNQDTRQSTTERQPNDERPALNCGEEEPFQKSMRPKHGSLHSLWDEWHGLNDFEDQFGGVKGREKKYGSKWRNKGMVNPQHFSRTKRVIAGIIAFAEREHIRQREAVARLDDLFCNTCKCSLAKMVEELKSMELIDERAPRFKKKKTNDE